MGNGVPGGRGNWKGGVVAPPTPGGVSFGFVIFARACFVRPKCRVLIRSSNSETRSEYIPLLRSVVYD